MVPVPRSDQRIGPSSTKSNRESTIHSTEAEPFSPTLPAILVTHGSTLARCCSTLDLEVVRATNVYRVAHLDRHVLTLVDEVPYVLAQLDGDLDVFPNDVFVVVETIPRDPDAPLVDVADVVAEVLAGLADLLDATAWLAQIWKR